MTFITALTLALLSQTAFGHGENALGPNGGYIRMPGAFHTEVKEAASGQLEVYLLDIAWKNPTVANSNVSVQLVRDKRAYDMKCTPTTTHFSCALPREIKLASGDKFTVKAVRAGVTGVPVDYPYPFKLTGAHH